MWNYYKICLSVLFYFPFVWALYCQSCDFQLIFSLTSSNFLVPVPNQDLDFQPHISWSFCVRCCKVILCFADIAGIVDQHWLNFLFIIIIQNLLREIIQTFYIMKVQNLISFVKNNCKLSWYLFVLNMNRWIQQYRQGQTTTE